LETKQKVKLLNYGIDPTVMPHLRTGRRRQRAAGPHCPTGRVVWLGEREQAA